MLKFKYSYVPCEFSYKKKNHSIDAVCAWISYGKCYFDQNCTVIRVSPCLHIHYHKLVCCRWTWPIKPFIMTLVFHKRNMWLRALETESADKWQVPAQRPTYWYLFHHNLQRPLQLKGLRLSESRGRPSHGFLFFFCLVGVLAGVRSEHESTEVIGDLLQLNVTRPVGAGLPSCAVIGRNPRRQTT